MNLHPLVIHEMSGLSPTLCILLGGVFTAFYTVAGGIDGVIWTDVAQTVVRVHLYPFRTLPSYSPCPFCVQWLLRPGGHLHGHVGTWYAPQRALTR